MAGFRQDFAALQYEKGKSDKRRKKRSKPQAARTTHADAAPLAFLTNGRARPPDTLDKMWRFRVQSSASIKGQETDSIRTSAVRFGVIRRRRRRARKRVLVSSRALNRRRARRPAIRPERTREEAMRTVGLFPVLRRPRAASVHESVCLSHAFVHNGCPGGGKKKTR